MSGFALQYELRNFAGITEHMARLENLDKSGLLEAIGAELESQTRRRIQEEKKSPDGEDWAEWSATHAATRHGGQSLLQGEGNLLDSIQFVVTGDQVEVGSNMVYAGVMQYGAKQGEFGRSSRNGPIPWGDIPAREYLGISDENAADIVAVANDWIDQVVGV